MVFLWFKNFVLNSFILPFYVHQVMSVDVSDVSLFEILWKTESLPLKQECCWYNGTSAAVWYSGEPRKMNFLDSSWLSLKKKEKKKRDNITFSDLSVQNRCMNIKSYELLCVFNFYYLIYFHLYFCDNSLVIPINVYVLFKKICSFICDCVVFLKRKKNSKMKEQHQKQEIVNRNLFSTDF